MSQPDNCKKAHNSLLLRCMLCLFTVGTLLGILTFPKVRAFNGRDMVLINVVLPILQAGRRAHKAGHPVAPALLQAAAGGFMLQKAFEQSIAAGSATGLEAWRAKLLLNFGASLAESAGTDRFVYRMDVGPVWVCADRFGVRIRPGIHGCIAPLINMSEGARFDWSNSVKYGTMAFKRSQRQDGTISRGGALAYSNANNFVTNPYGAHAGHELVHTFQYRRDVFLIPGISDLFPGVRRHLGDGWIDDTGWFTNWAAQGIWAEQTGRSRDFDTPLEQEAYYLENTYSPR